MLALAKIGRNPDTGLGAGDVAYRLIHNDTFPSWGFSIFPTFRLRLCNDETKAI
jgi:hypothetical protein